MYPVSLLQLAHSTYNTKSMTRSISRCVHQLPVQVHCITASALTLNCLHAVVQTLLHNELVAQTAINLAKRHHIWYSHSKSHWVAVSAYLPHTTTRTSNLPSKMRDTALPTLTALQRRFDRTAAAVGGKGTDVHPQSTIDTHELVSSTLQSSPRVYNSTVHNSSKIHVEIQHGTWPTYTDSGSLSQQYLKEQHMVKQHTTEASIMHVTIVYMISSLPWT